MTLLRSIINKVPILRQLANSYRDYRNQRARIEEFRKRLSTRPLKLVIGAGGIYEPGWIPTEIGQLNLLQPEDWRAVLKRNSIDAILAEHVWEHLTEADGLRAARQCHEYLRPGGYLRVAVPDGFHPSPEYIDYVRPGGHGAGADDHHVLYDFRTFSRLFENAGFRVELLEYFDEEGKFHFVDWDPNQGKIHRSRRFDERNEGGTLNYTSLILDAHKPD